MSAEFDSYLHMQNPTIPEQRDAEYASVDSIISARMLRYFDDPRVVRGGGLHKVGGNRVIGYSDKGVLIAPLGTKRPTRIIIPWHRVYDFSYYKDDTTLLKNF